MYQCKKNNIFLAFIISYCKPLPASTKILCEHFYYTVNKQNFKKCSKFYFFFFVNTLKFNLLLQGKRKQLPDYHFAEIWHSRHKGLENISQRLDWFLRFRAALQKLSCNDQLPVLISIYENKRSKLKTVHLYSNIHWSQ